MNQPALMPTAGMARVSTHWYQTRDGDDHARALFARHYSRYIYRDGRAPKLFVGPGEKLVLLTEPGDALFVWRRFRSAAGQVGVNCAVFRNEGTVLSSVLIREADAIAESKWPGQRHYTYVDPRKVGGDGKCFKAAGWRKCGRTAKRRLVILERAAALGEAKP